MKHRKNNRNTERTWNGTGLLLGMMLAMLMLPSAGSWSQAAGSDTSEVAEIKALIDKYAESIDKADVNLAAQVWLQEDNVTFINPRDYLMGWEEVKTSFYQDNMGGRFTGRKLKVRDVEIRVYANMAWAVFDWDFTAKMRNDGSPYHTKGRETHVLRKTDQGWRILHVLGMARRGTEE